MEVLNWKFPVATFIARSVYAASKEFCDIVKSEANQKRFQWVFDQARPWVITGLTESLGLARVAVLKMLGVWGPLVDKATEMLIEAAYQAMKAAGEAKPPVVVKAAGVESDWDYKLVKHVHENGGADIVFGPTRTGTPINRPAPESVVDTHDQAEPGNGE